MQKDFFTNFFFFKKKSLFNYNKRECVKKKIQDLVEKKGVKIHA